MSTNRRGNQRHIVAELTAAEFHHLFHHPPLADAARLEAILTEGFEGKTLPFNRTN